MPKIALDKTPLKKLQEQLSPEKFKETYKKAITEALKRITPIVRGYLVDNYDKSKLQDKSGDLRKAIGNSLVLLGKDGLTFILPAGLPTKIYVYAAAHQYGANRNSAGKSKTVRKKLKQQAASLFKATGVTKQGGSSYIPPTPFYFLTASQMEHVVYIFFLVIQEVFDKDYK